MYTSSTRAFDCLSCVLLLAFADVCNFLPENRVRSYILFQLAAETDLVTRPPEGQFLPRWLIALPTSCSLLPHLKLPSLHLLFTGRTCAATQLHLWVPSYAQMLWIRPLMAAVHRATEHHLLTLRQLIVYPNSTTPACLFFEFIHLSSLLGSSVHHPPC